MKPLALATSDVEMDVMGIAYDEFAAEQREAVVAANGQVNGERAWIPWRYDRKLWIVEPVTPAGYRPA